MRTGQALPHLRAWREWRGLSQRELAAIAGVTFSTVATIETGKHRAVPSTVQKLARGLRIGVDELLHVAPAESRREQRRLAQLRAAAGGD